MKKALITLAVIASIAITSCSTSRGGCGDWKDVQRHDSKPFRARLMKIENIGIGYKLHWRRMNNYYESYCTSYPDSLKVGGYYCL